jgi:sugar diacid utilization regulator
MVAIETERSRAPERESDAAVRDLVSDLLNRRATDRENIVARANELGADLAGGAAVVVVRARPQHPEEGDWRARVAMMAERGARGVARTALVARVPLAVLKPRHGDDGKDDELVVLLPSADAELVERAATAILRELDASLQGYHVAVASSRPATDATDVHRAGAEALLAANVAEAQGDELLAFDDTGAYRLLLPAMSEDPLELQRFYDETVAPLVAYDEEYETELLRTLETFLELDGGVAGTADRLFTHRHTIRYRLERARDLTGLDVSSSDGRERLSLGLKAMRVLGIAPPHGPATEPGTKGGRVRKDKDDR